MRGANVKLKRSEHRVHVLEAGFKKRHPYKKLRERLFRPYWFPLENCKWELRDLGIEVRFSRTIDDRLWDCDVLIASSRTVDALVRSREFPFATRAEFCSFAKAKVPRLFWFDSRDSAGNCQFDVLPYVEKYLKRQMYKDRQLYLRKFYYGRMFSDYYHREYHVAGELDWEKSGGATALEAAPYDPNETAATLSELDKICVAWSCGAEFHWPLLSAASIPRYFACAAASRLVRACSPRPDVVDAYRPRSVDASALFDSTRYSVKSVGYQRQLALEAIGHINNREVRAGRVPRAVFYRTLRNSKITVSAFGWGEVCYREYEATYCGSAILMADMSSVSAYPDFYVADKYYVPYKWDFSDFEEKVEALLSDDEHRRGMAADAQKMLIAQWTPEGRRSFASRFATILQPSDRATRPVDGAKAKEAKGSNLV
jgi:glycosyltransferase involved in cell wall biosynthesis